MTNKPYYSETYIPAVTVEGKAVPDWLSSTYLGLPLQTFQHVLHRVTSVDSGQPDYAAYKYYGNESWWWLICDYNGIVNPATDYKPGLLVKIPDLNEVLIYLRQVALAATADDKASFVRL